MKDWIKQGDNALEFSRMCYNETPITIFYSDNPDDKLDCIPVWLTGDAYSVIVDEDNNRYGFTRGQEVHGDPYEIGDVIIREKQPAAQSA